MLDSAGDLNPVTDLIVKDIFRRLDKIVINNALEYPEFSEFFSRLGGRKLSEEDFRQTILKNYCCAERAGQVNRRGFI